MAESIYCKCGNLRRGPKQRYCRECHAESMRRNRPKHSDMTEEQKKKANCRSYANTYKRRGKLIPESCVECGSYETQMHHDNYDRPLQVVWLCRDCHLNYHSVT